MIFKAYSYACLLVFVFLLPSSIVTFAYNYQGSKSNFCYILMICTFADAIIHLGQFLTNLFPVEVIENNNTILMPNVYATLTVNYSFLLLTLQTWLFSMKYLKSATECSLTPTRLTVNLIQKINWIGSIFFVTSLLVFWGVLMITWPGYISRAEIINWFEKYISIIGLS